MAFKHPRQYVGHIVGNQAFITTQAHTQTSLQTQKTILPTRATQAPFITAIQCNTIDNEYGAYHISVQKNQIKHLAVSMNGTVRRNVFIYAVQYEHIYSFIKKRLEYTLLGLK